MISLLSEASKFTAHPVKSAPVNKNELHGQSCTLQAQIINHILLTEVVFVEMEGDGEEVAASVGMELGGRHFCATINHLLGVQVYLALFFLFYPSGERKQRERVKTC